MTTRARICRAAALVIAGSVVGGTALAQDPAPVFAQDDPARIWIDGDAMHFFGSISIASQDAFLDFVASQDTSSVRSFVVNSLGGDTNSGRVIGRWVNERGLDVVADAICFSSCANYIFTMQSITCSTGTRTFFASSFIG